MLTSQPVLSGSDYRYKWLTRTRSHAEQESFKLLSPAVARRPSSALPPLILSSRFRELLQMVGQQRLEKMKQLIVVDSETLACSVARQLLAQGLRVVELHARADADGPGDFFESESVLRFNAASPATIGLVCFPSFLLPSTAPASCSVPVVASVLVAEKPVTTTSSTLYHNFLLALVSPANRGAKVHEIYSETEVRLLLHPSPSENATVSPEDCVAMLHGVSKRDRREKSVVCEVLDDATWSAIEEHHVNREFLFEENESGLVALV